LASLPFFVRSSASSTRFFFRIPFTGTASTFVRLVYSYRCFFRIPLLDLLLLSSASRLLRSSSAFPLRVLSTSRTGSLRVTVFVVFGSTRTRTLFASRRYGMDVRIRCSNRTRARTRTTLFALRLLTFVVVVLELVRYECRGTRIASFSSQYEYIQYPQPRRKVGNILVPYGRSLCTDGIFRVRVITTMTTM